MNSRQWLARLSSLFRKTRLEQQLDQDIQEHLDLATEENLRRGMTQQEASEAARRSFGGRDQMKEVYRDQRGVPALKTLARETRFALRSLRRAPAFTALAMLTLALAIGANSAVFSAVNALLFHPPGVADPSRVVVVRSKYTKLKIPNIVISATDFKAVRDSPEIFASAAIAKSGDFNYNGGPYPQRLAALQVSSRWFEVFGTKPALGRVFRAEEDQPRNKRVAILSFNAWQRLFAADPSIVEKTILLDQTSYKIVGVMGPESTFGIDFLGGLTSQPPDILVSLGFNENQDPRSAGTETFLSVARLQPGVSFERAQAFMAVLTERNIQARPSGRFLKENGWGLFLVRYTDYAGGDMKTPLLILWAAVALVLLIACSNIAGLMLARASAHSRELAVRAALGGSRWHLVRQMLVESLLLAAAGALLGLAIAYVFLRGVIATQPDNITAALHIPFDLRVLLFTTLAAIVSAVLFAIAPAIQSGRGNMSGTLNETGRPVTAGPDRLRLRSLLVASEVALALVLSVGAGLFLRSLSRIQKIDTGFQPQNVMSASVVLPEARYKSEAQVIDFFRSSIDRLQAIPGVHSAAASYPLPFGGGFEGRAFQIVNHPIREGDPAPLAQSRIVTPGFFSTLHIPVQRGRTFTAEDAIKTHHITVIDDALARQYWPNEDPLGQQIALQSGERATIVGIVGHIKQSDLAADLDHGVLYFSFYQYPLAFGTFVVQSATPALTPAAIRDAVNSVDPAQPIYDAKTMDQRISATLAGRRFTVALLSLFAITAVFLAALGLYGVINYGVTQRTQEIGIRMALGAQRIQVLSLIVGQGIRIAAIGLAIGLCAAYAIASLIPNQLFGVSALDPVTFLSTALALTLVAILASYLPARRATKLDPVEALR